MSYIPTETGQWVSEDFARLAEVIQDYDSALELRWIPPEHRTRDDKEPYMIYDTRMHSVVFYASELDTPVGILEKLFRGDIRKHNVLANLEAHEAAQKALDFKKKMEEYEDMADQAKFLSQSPLNTLRFNGKKFDHNRRVIE